LFEVLPARSRIVIVAFLLPIAAFFVLWAVGALSNLWADYKDSSATTYLLVGGVFSLLALAALAIVFQVLRRADTTTRLQALATGALLYVAGGVFRGDRE
jgi:predicted membrane channel-forming protein YqfA (hemolysin III family)